MRGAEGREDAKEGRREGGETNEGSPWKVGRKGGEGVREGVGGRRKEGALASPRDNVVTMEGVVVGGCFLGAYLLAWLLRVLFALLVCLFVCLSRVSSLFRLFRLPPPPR